MDGAVRNKNLLSDAMLRNPCLVWISKLDFDIAIYLVEPPKSQLLPWTDCLLIPTNILHFLLNLEGCL